MSKNMILGYFTVYTLSMLSLFFFLIFPYATSLDFNLSDIGTSESSAINCTGDAYISIQGIQVTPDPDEKSESSLKWKTGRATYIQPLHLWDNASGNLSDWITEFSFVIEGNNYGEGFAFFLAPNNSKIPPGSAGGGLGLINENQTMVASSTNAFVAVKFDTYQNTWEAGLPINYVGININSRKSVHITTWSNNITYGKTNNATIMYNSVTKNLSVVFTGYEDNTPFPQNLHHIVDLRDHLPEWVNFGFSASTGESYEKNSVKSWVFNTSLPINKPAKESAAQKSKTGLIVGFAVGSVILVIVITMICFFLRKRGMRKKQGRPVGEQFMDEEFRKGSGAREFSYDGLAAATKNFSEEEKLGEGGFGGVYRGFIRQLNTFVAVKKISSGSKQGLKEYASEVKIISQLRHRNLVQLMGWCHGKGELLLVYELVPNGSLDNHLFRANSLLIWEARFKIAQGLASAVCYLHDEWEQCVVHRDIKSSNVMLDLNFNAKLGDFGLARLVDHEQEVQTTDMAGTMGYMAPECLATGKASKESDVYSFGVVALEIACGRRPIEPRAGEQNQVRMVEWVWEMYGTGRLLEAADSRLGVDFDEEQMERLMVVGMWCAHPDHTQRPSIRQASLALNFEVPLPFLPARMPLPTSFGAPSISSSHYGSGSGTSNSTKLPSSSAADSSTASLG